MDYTILKNMFTEHNTDQCPLSFTAGALKYYTQLRKLTLPPKKEKGN